MSEETGTINETLDDAAFNDAAVEQVNIVLEVHNSVIGGSNNGTLGE